MTDRLRLTISHDDDGTGELHAQVVANGFSGKGFAWFDLLHLADFARTLGNAFPLENVMELRGGYWAKDGTGLTQEHLALRFYPVGGRGVVGCQVRLSSPVLEHDRPEEQHRLRVELFTHYQELQEFAGTFQMLAEGKALEVILSGAAV